MSYPIVSIGCLDSIYINQPFTLTLGIKNWGEEFGFSPQIYITLCCEITLIDIPKSWNLVGYWSKIKGYWTLSPNGEGEKVKDVEFQGQEDNDILYHYEVDTLGLHPNQMEHLITFKLSVMENKGGLVGQKYQISGRGRFKDSCQKGWTNYIFYPKGITLTEKGFFFPPYQTLPINSVIQWLDKKWKIKADMIFYTGVLVSNWDQYGELVSDDVPLKSIGQGYDYMLELITEYPIEPANLSSDPVEPDHKCEWSVKQVKDRLKFKIKAINLTDYDSYWYAPKGFVSAKKEHFKIHWAKDQTMSLSIPLPTHFWLPDQTVICFYVETPALNYQTIYRWTWNAVRLVVRSRWIKIPSEMKVIGTVVEQKDWKAIDVEHLPEWTVVDVPTSGQLHYMVLVANIGSRTATEIKIDQIKDETKWSYESRIISEKGTLIQSLAPNEVAWYIGMISWTKLPPNTLVHFQVKVNKEMGLNMDSISLLGIPIPISWKSVIVDDSHIHLYNTSSEAIWTGDRFIDPNCYQELIYEFNIQMIITWFMGESSVSIPILVSKPAVSVKSEYGELILTNLTSSEVNIEWTWLDKPHFWLNDEGEDCASALVLAGHESHSGQWLSDRYCQYKMDYWTDKSTIYSYRGCLTWDNYDLARLDMVIESSIYGTSLLALRDIVTITYHLHVPSSGISLNHIQTKLDGIRWKLLSSSTLLIGQPITARALPYPLTVIEKDGVIFFPWANVISGTHVIDIGDETKHIPSKYTWSIKLKVKQIKDEQCSITSLLQSIEKSTTFDSLVKTVKPILDLDPNWNLVNTGSGDAHNLKMKWVNKSGQKWIQTEPVLRCGFKLPLLPPEWAESVTITWKEKGYLHFPIPKYDLKVLWLQDNTISICTHHPIPIPLTLTVDYGLNRMDKLYPPYPETCFPLTWKLSDLISETFQFKLIDAQDQLTISLGTITKTIHVPEGWLQLHPLSLKSHYPVNQPSKLAFRLSHLPTSEDVIVKQVTFSTNSTVKLDYVSPKNLTLNKDQQWVINCVIHPTQKGTEWIQISVDHTRQYHPLIYWMRLEIL